MSTLQDVGTIVGIAAGIAVIISVAYGIHRRMREEQPKFLTQKFSEPTQKPVKSNWSIRVLHPDKLIEKCIVLYDDVRLPWWDRDDPYYERTLVRGGGGNVRIPVEIEKADAEIKIMDGKKTLKRIEFKDITESKP